MKIKFLIILIAVILIPELMEAQCAMCKAVVEDATANVDKNIGRGINTGIVYIMFLPWALLIIGGLVFFRDRIKSLLNFHK